MAGGDASSGEEVDAGFEFAFDNEAFSDKVLRLEVFGSDDAPGSGTDAASCKRRREEAQGDDGEGIASCTLMAKPILRVKTIHINSAILAAKSHFFFKLFSSGMKGSERQTTLRIANSEENTFMELLHFLYSGKLSPTSEATLLVDIMMASEKFEVVSCMRLCRQRLRNLPMIPESSVTSLDLSCSNLVAAELTEAAKIFLAKRYEDFLSREFEDELMRIPLAGIEAILSKE